MGILARRSPKQASASFRDGVGRNAVQLEMATKDCGPPMHGLKIATNNQLGPRPKGARRGIGKRSRIATAKRNTR
jgi:hypothetical protein